MSFHGERWDRDRFEREGSRRAPVLEQEYDEEDYYSRPGFREERDIHEEDYRRPAPPASSAGRGERERVFFEEREQYGAPVPYRPRRESVRYYDDRETVREAEVVPYRERENEREIDVKYTRQSAPSRRPQFIRRQSSLDTFDRKPMPRYGDRVREEVVIPRPPRRRSPPRFDYEEIRVAEPEHYGDDEYRPYREREIETFRRRYPDPPPREEETIEEREEIVEEFPKRGKTKMPRRLVNVRAITNLGYTYEEEGETIIIQKALGKDHIDEVIRISREYNEGAPPPETRVTYQIEAPSPQPTPSEQPMPPPPPPQFEEEEIIKKETKIIRENPSLAETSTASSRSSSPSASTVTAVSRKSHRTSHSHHHSHKSHSRAHSRSTIRSEKSRRHRSLSSSRSNRELVIHDRHYHDDPHDTTLIIPGRESRSHRSIQAEIRALEAEKKALRYEREAEKYRHGSEVILEKEYRDGTVEIKKDRRGPDSRLIKAMLATLT